MAKVVARVSARPGNPTAPTDQQMYLRALRTVPNLSITYDSDLVEPARIVRDELGFPVGILNPHQHHSAELKRIATFLKRIRQSDLIASQFAPVLNDAKGAFHKPASW